MATRKRNGIRLHEGFRIKFCSVYMDFFIYLSVLYRCKNHRIEDKPLVITQKDLLLQKFLSTLTQISFSLYVHVSVFSLRPKA